jgi:hypothetical protein
LYGWHSKKKKKNFALLSSSLASLFLRPYKKKTSRIMANTQLPADLEDFVSKEVASL